MKKYFVICITFGFLSLLLIPLLCISAESSICSEAVSTEQGMIRGFVEAEHGSCSWKGIPYAAPPVGDLRFRAPQAPARHEGVFEADRCGKSCLQKAMLTNGGDIGQTGEDCLVLNIWSPPKPGKFPVMVWLHGGGFRQGTGNFEMYSGAHLAADKGVVVVTINYRIGAFGFMALPELKAEDPHGSTGNYGILDQIQALKWVQKNISGFRGDPDNVTLFGQSAGGISTCILLASPLSEGLFHQAIIESGMCDFMEREERGYERSREEAGKLGCTGPDVVHCLRALPEKKFMPTGGNLLLEGGIPYLPHIDGYVADKQPIDNIRAGNYHKMPVLMGSNKDEIKVYTLTIPGLSLINRPTMNLIMKKLTGDSGDKILSLYSYDDYRRPIGLFHAVATDLAFHTRVFMAAEAMSQYSPVYVYRFDWDDLRFPDKMGAFHGLEISLVFGNLTLSSKMARIVANQKIVDSAKPLVSDMMSYWTNFARTGNPDGPGLTVWPQYNSATRERIYLDTPISTGRISVREIERYRVLEDYTLAGIRMERKSE